MKIHGMLLAALIVLCSLPVVSIAGSPATGEFVATKTCAAYQSIRKITNPGNIVLTVGNHHSVVEVNSASTRSWYRVAIDDASPRDRWVSEDCGIAHVSMEQNRSGGTSSGSCNVAGEEDSYVFAVSWQPAFCDGHRDKPECSVTDPKSYQATHFTLHGLWPNKESCGTRYGFCGKYQKVVRPFCDMDPLPMSPNVLKQLGTVMPSAAYGSCLQRHEWYKHGTCQTEWDADGYFDEAMHLLGEFNGDDKDGIAAFMVHHMGQTVTIDALNAEIDQQFGSGAHERMQYSCTRDDKLLDIYISLPAKLGDRSLGTLIQMAHKHYVNKCGDTFVVDRITD